MTDRRKSLTVAVVLGLLPMAAEMERWNWLGECARGGGLF
jgi:hypothetical protein